MKKTIMITLGGLAFLAVHLLLLPGISSAKKVDCGKKKPKSLQDAINKAKSGDTIEIKGLCKEKEVTVPGDKADLTLLGVGPVAGTGGQR